MKLQKFLGYYCAKYIIIGEDKQLSLGIFFTVNCLLLTAHSLLCQATNW
jgi:hypothetical protein